MTHASPARARDVMGTDHLPAALAGAVVTALLVICAALGTAGLIAALAIVQVGLVVAWLIAIDLPSPVNTAAVAAAAVIATDVVLQVRDRESLDGLVAVIGIGFVAMIVAQLARRGGRDRLTAGLTGDAALIVVVAAFGALLVLDRIKLGSDLLAAVVLAIGVALIVGHLVDAVMPLPRFAQDVSRGLLGLLAGAVAAAVVALARLHGQDGISTPGALFLGGGLGLLAGLVAVGMAYVAVSSTPRELPAAWLALPYLQVAVPLALCAPVGYLLGRVVTG